MRTVFTGEMAAFIRENAKNYNRNELCSKVNIFFNSSLSVRQIVDYCCRNKIKYKPIQDRFYLTADMLNFLKIYASDNNVSELAYKFNNNFNTSLSDEKIAFICNRYGIKYRYKQFKYTDEMHLFLVENFKNMEFDELLSRFNMKFETSISKTGLQKRCNILGLLQEKVVLTEEMKKFIDENIHRLNKRKLVKELNIKFNSNITNNIVNYYCTKNGYSSCQTFTQEMINYLIKHGTGKTAQELCRKFNKYFNKKFSSSTIKRKCKDLRIDIVIRNQSGQELGTEANNLRGMVVKVGRKKWISKQRYIYEQAHGTLKDDEKVIFIDGDSTNYNLDNLVKVNLREYGYCNLLQPFRTKDKELFKAYLALINFKMAYSERKKEVNLHEKKQSKAETEDA